MFNYVVECLVSNCSLAICVLFELFYGIREHLMLMKGRAVPGFFVSLVLAYFSQAGRTSI